MKTMKRLSVFVMMLAMFTVTPAMPAQPEADYAIQPLCFLDEVIDSV